MGAAGQQLGLRLFLEGLEVPVVAANVQVGINSPAVASIQVVPGDRLLELKARTMVHLFFWDYTRDNLPAIDALDPEAVAAHLEISIDEARDIIANKPETLADIDDLKGYRLLFAGEVIGVTLVKTPAGRQAVLQCSDFSTYWDTTYQFFVSYSPNGNFLGTSAAVWAGGSSMFDDLTAGHTSVMNEYLRRKPKTPGLENVGGLTGGIISLLEAMGGVPSHTHGVNDFFTIAELKNHILQQIVAESNDDTAQRLFDDKAFMDWLTRGMSSLGQLTTFRDMMKLLFKYVYYEVVPNPAAMYTPGERPTITKKNQVVSVTTGGSGLSDGAKDQVKEMRDRAASESNAATSVDKAPGSFLGFDYARLYIERLTSILGTEGAASGPSRDYLNKSITHLEGVEKIPNLGPLPFNQDLQADESQDRARGPAAAAIIRNSKRWNLVKENLDKALIDAPGRTSKRAIEKQVGGKPKVDRLNTQIFRPDCFFAAPPRCNVLFPDQYTQFSFSRNFLQEVTRLRLSVGWLFGASSGGLLAEYHFAPATTDIKKLAKKQGNSSIRALLPWEKYSGILPKFETIHEINYVAGRNERKKGISKGKIVGQAKSYPQRVANFNYMKYRFAARTCEVSARFNPFLVCGFPALIIERPFVIDPNSPMDSERLTAALERVNSGREQKISKDDISDHIREIAREFGAPSQYLGMIAALSHNVDQSGGGTSIVLTHARTHRITEDDFLNVFSKELTNDVETELVSTALDAEDALGRGDWKNLRFLIDATDQEIGNKLPQLLEEEQSSPTTEDDTELVERPDGGPNLSTVPQLSPFASLLAIPPPEQDFDTSSSASTDSPEQRVKLRGKIKKSRLKKSRRVILEPDLYGKLRPGSKGPQGGKVVHVQVFSDDAIMVTGVDVNRAVSYRPVIVGEGELAEFTTNKTTGKPKKKRAETVKSTSKFFMWRKIVIHEERALKTKLTKTLPVEEALRPPWFSPLYSNWFIGQEIYGPFFGTGSIVDQALFSAPGGQAVFGTGREEQQRLLDELRDAGGDHKKIVQILDKAKADSLSDVPDIESSADALAYLYGEVTRLGLDVHRFVHDYTSRPIATLEEILGSRDLEYSVEGNVLKLVSGIPGFHSTAVGDFGGNLLGLLDNPDLELSRLKKTSGKKAPISRDLDPRPGRRERVVAYLQEINASSGSLGVGIVG